MQGLAVSPNHVERAVMDAVTLITGPSCEDFLALGVGVADLV